MVYVVRVIIPNKVNSKVAKEGYLRAYKGTKHLLIQRFDDSLRGGLKDDLEKDDLGNSKN